MRLPWRRGPRPLPDPAVGLGLGTRYVDVLELWPDHGHSPLWSSAQKRYVDPAELPVPASLAERLTTFGDGYAEERVPVEGEGDPAYLAEGTALLAELRSALGDRYRVVVTEPWLGEEPEDL